MDEPFGSHMTFPVCLLLFFHRERSRAPSGRVGAAGSRGALSGLVGKLWAGSVPAGPGAAQALAVSVSVPLLLLALQTQALQPSPPWLWAAQRSDVMGSFQVDRTSSKPSDFSPLYAVDSCCWPWKPHPAAWGAATGLDPLPSPPCSPPTRPGSPLTSIPGPGPAPAPEQGREAGRKESQRNRRSKGASSEKQGHRTLQRTKGHPCWP